MATNLNKLAKEIIQNNQYMTISSTDISGLPWVSPVVYSFDDKYNFYFVSIPNSRHCKNFKENNKIALAIFDSRQLIGEGVGLQVEGIVTEVKFTEVPSVAAIYFKRLYPYGKMHHAFDEALKTFLARKLYRFYKVTPTKIWMNNPDSKIDKRVEVIIRD